MITNNECEGAEAETMLSGFSGKKDAYIKLPFRGIGLAAILGLALSGCSSEASSKVPLGPDGQRMLKVVTTFYPMYEFIRQVAGEYAEVSVLIPAGAEPHEWEPTGKDMIRIKQSDLLVYNGAGVERWVDKAMKSVNKDPSKVVEASRGLELMTGIAEEDEHDGHSGGSAGKEPDSELDPHVWLDPALARKEVYNIEAALERADPARKDIYKHNADAYADKLETLDQLFKSELLTVKRKEFVTQHAAFGYMAKHYGLTQVPIAGLSPEQEPSGARMSEVIQFVKSRQIHTIFFETLAAPKVAATIARETGAQTAVLNPIEGLTKADQKANLDYIEIMKQNLAALKAALNE
jgi:zinc transport system substrate-binding protein